MFDHVTIRVADPVAAHAFYDTVLGRLGIGRTSPPGDPYTKWGDLSTIATDAEHPPTRGLHIGFIAPSRAHVDDFWAAGTAAGHPDDGAPGPRPQYMPDFYGAFLLDPQGNSAEAGHYEGMRVRGTIDHLWIRVADVDAAQRFYETISPLFGLAVARLGDTHVIVRGRDHGSMSLVNTPPTPLTEPVHIAFAAPDPATVDVFHATALAGGYTDNGPPGIRAEYSRGYYGASVLDSAGHNVEAVHHEPTR